MKLFSRFAIGVLALTAISAEADEVRKLDGDKHSGTIQSVSATEVTLADSVRQTIVPVNEIAAVIFSPEPRGLTEGRAAYDAGRYADVATSLNEIKPDQVRRDEIQTEIEFYRTMSAARLAILAGVDPKAATAAGTELIAFLIAHKTSHHYYEVNEALGDLLAAMKHPSADRYYDVVAAAPWPEFKIRANLLKGRAAQWNGNHTAAIQYFDAALAIPASGQAAETQSLLARVGRAASLSETGNADEAMKLLDDVIAKADERNTEVHARAYNALGGCFRKKGATTDALLEYLKVDLLFNSIPDAHAEALYYLSQLWNEARQPERARAAAEALKQQYAASRWNKS